MWRHLATVTACVDVILEYFATCPSVLSKALLAQYMHIAIAQKNSLHTCRTSYAAYIKYTKWRQFLFQR